MKIQLKIQTNFLTSLLFLNILFFLISNIFLYLFGNVTTQYELVGLVGAFDFFKITDGWLWLLLTSAFLHFDIFHLLINMYSLYRIGQIVVNYYGEKVLFLTYVIGGIAGSLLTYLVANFEILNTGRSVNLLSVGASGAIFALIGLLLGATLRKSRYGFDLPFTFADVLPIVLFSLLLGFTPGTNINNWAHLGGLFSGVALGLLLPHLLGYKSKNINSIEKILYVGSLGLTALAFFSLVVNFILVVFIK